MELNRKQVIKALECCTSGNPCCRCAYRRKGTDTYGCRKICMIDALSLIKELTVELDAMRGAANSYKMHNQCLTELNERLRVVADMSDATLTDALRIVNEFCDKRIKRAISDTVRKMQTEIEARCIKGGIYPAFVKSTIDQIAEEMLKEVTTDGNKKD